MDDRWREKDKISIHWVKVLECCW